MELISVLSEQQEKQTAELAALIWREHYVPIIGSDQVEYMLATFQSEEAIHRQIVSEGYSYYLISGGTSQFADSPPAGYLAFCRRNGQDPNADSQEAGRERGMFLSKIYLRSEFRGQKLAKLAVRFLENLCLAEGFAYLWLTVNRENLASKAAYERMGFRLWFEQKSEIGNGYFMDDFVMRKQVTERTLVDCGPHACACRKR